jgi:hypothetical protein
MATDINTTVGIDTKEFERGLKDVTKSAEAAGGGSSSAASQLGKVFGYAKMVMDTIGPIFDKFLEYAQQAQKLRNLSIATNIPIGDLQSYAVVAKNAGISLDAFAHSVAEFNKKIGAAKIQGSEANAALTKLGFGLKDITKGQVGYQESLYALADAYQAGTDEATLMHYGIQLFGSSFEQLLPLVKQGSGEMRKQFENTYKSEENLARAAARSADMWSRTGSLIEAIMIDIVGMFAEAGEDIVDEVNNQFAGAWAAFKGIFVDKKVILGDLAADVYKQQSSGKTKEERQKYYDYWMREYSLSEDEKKIFMDRIKELEGGKNGKKLTPQGLSEAQGASAIQQMGGGDIMSAIAFNPLQQIAENTGRTAQNTDPSRAPQPQAPRPVPIEAR